MISPVNVFQLVFLAAGTGWAPPPAASGCKISAPQMDFFPRRAETLGQLVLAPPTNISLFNVEIPPLQEIEVPEINVYVNPPR